MTLSEQLKGLPEGFIEAGELIAGVDECLKVGFARLTADQRSALSQLADTLAESPLGNAMHDAVAAMQRSEFLVRQFCVLAAARAALQGAQYDALRNHLLTILDQEASEVQQPTTVGPGGSAAALASVQQWLMEIAISGFQHLEEATVAPFVSTLENIQAEQELTGLASLLTGFVNELLRYMPVERHPSLPVFRWADLWTAAMVRTQHITLEPPGTSVSGSVALLGTDIRSHENFVAVSVYGVLQSDKGRRPVRIPLTGYKVDVIHGAEIWDLFGDVSDPILKALESKKTLQVDKAELRPSGDLLLRSKPGLGKAADPFSVVDDLSLLPAVPPMARHPVHLAELVCVDGDCDLPIAEERLSTDCEFTDKVLSAATQIIGLLRFDGGGWRLQPLSVKTGKQTIVAGESVAKVRAKLKSKTLAILRERSGKLLRE